MSMRGSEQHFEKIDILSSLLKLKNYLGAHSKNLVRNMCYPQHLLGKYFERKKGNRMNGRCNGYRKIARTLLFMLAPFFLQATELRKIPFSIECYCCVFVECISL